MKENLKNLLIEQRKLLSILSSVLLSDSNRKNKELEYNLLYSKIQIIKNKLSFNDYLEVIKKI